MGYMREYKDKKYFNNLPSNLQKKYFNLTRDKFLPTIDNIYYSVFLECDSNENALIKPLLSELESLKQFVIESHEPQGYKNGLNVSNITEP